ncbi:MAG: DUF3800 domain-containing protein [Candidatus Omnitrophica bacterium]|nr:DUF3800 domain-containing protein [Candidatus Omnitrophota bacterium]
MKIFHIYSDESRHKNERFLLLSGIWIEEAKIKIAEAEIAALRKKHGYINSLGQHIDFLGEFKWTKVSTKYLSVYKGITDIFFNWVDKDIVRFNVLLVDTQNPSVTEYGNIREEGYFKLLYQLYYHNSKIPGIYKIYPDSITNPVQARVNLDMLHKCLEKSLRRKFTPLLNPQMTENLPCFVKNILPVDSKHTPLIQVADVIMGALGYLQNELYRVPLAKKAKVELMKYILEKIVLSGAIQIKGKKYYVARSKKFNIWLFRPNKKTSLF